MRTALVPFVIAAVVAAAACRDRPAGPAKPTAPPTATSPPAATAPIPVDPALAMLTLPERLQREAAARPRGMPACDKVLQTLTAAGVPVGRSRQVLASPVGARYCETAKTTSGLGLAICEFATEDDAKRGREHSRRQFDHLIPNRTLIVRGQTLLTITRGGDTASIDAEAKRTAALFSAL